MINENQYFTVSSCKMLIGTSKSNQNLDPHRKTSWIFKN